MRRNRGLRLPLRRRPDPVLTPDELEFIADELRVRARERESIMARGRVSESVIRQQRCYEDVMPKLFAAGAYQLKSER